MKTRARKHWTTKEDQVLIDTITPSYRPFDLLASQLDRPLTGVKQRTAKLIRAGKIPNHEIWWSKKEITKLKRHIILAETNEVINIPELMAKLGKKEQAIRDKIHWLRERGELPKADRSLQFDDYRRPYTEREERMIIWMYERGEKIDVIAEQLNRTSAGIQGKLANLKKQGRVKTQIKIWSDDEVKFLMMNLRFDMNGYTTNVKEISQYLKCTYDQVSWKVKSLRKQGVIKILPDKNTIGVNSAVAFHELMKEFNERRFISYMIRKEMYSSPQKKTDSPAS